jgi:hypothetical protein
LLQVEFNKAAISLADNINDEHIKKQALNRLLKVRRCAHATAVQLSWAGYMSSVVLFNTLGEDVGVAHLALGWPSYMSLAELCMWAVLMCVLDGPHRPKEYCADFIACTGGRKHVLFLCRSMYLASESPINRSPPKQLAGRNIW